jgi:hypothetical protein
MKCWECKKEIKLARRVPYCDGFVSKFRDVCYDYLGKLKTDDCHQVRVERITRGQLKIKRR